MLTNNNLNSERIKSITTGSLHFSLPPPPLPRNSIHINVYVALPSHGMLSRRKENLHQAKYSQKLPLQLQMRRMLVMEGLETSYCVDLPHQSQLAILAAMRNGGCIYVTLDAFLIPVACYRHDPRMAYPRMG